MGEGITDAELQAYVDGELDTAGRIAVETHLCHHPEAAAGVLEDLRLRDELRLFVGEDGRSPAPAPPPPPPRSVGLARELARALHRRSWRVRLRRGLVAAVLLACGWFAHDEFDLFVDPVAAAPTAPTYADEAAEAYAALAAKLGAGIAPDRALLLPLPAPVTGGDVPMPELASTLRFLGSDLVPWDGGVALVALHDAGGGRLVTLFAAEVATFAVEPPRAAEVHGRPTLFWQHGRFAYALNGALPVAELTRLAEAAAARPWALDRNQPSPSGGTHG